MADYLFDKLDFDDLKENIINYIKDSDEFQDYSFDGSALNSIANLLTYITLQQNYYLNMTTQELYLDTATLYKNAVVIAKSLNYIPHRKISSSLKIKMKCVTLEKEIEEDYGILIPQNCLFSVGGKKFITEASYTILDKISETEISLYQRELYEETFTFDGSDIELLYGYDIDDNFLSVTVDGVLWTEYRNNISGTSDSEIYFVDLNLDDKLVITFGDNIIGKKPLNGVEIKVTYGVTEGVLGNSLTDATLDQTVYSNVTAFDNSDFLITSEVSNGGLNEESLNSIKTNAPKFYEAQNRAVTRQDYQALLKDISFVEILNVWNGADESPPTYGTIFSTFKPVDTISNLSDTQKDEIYSFIRPYMPLSIVLKIIDPIYIYVNISSKIYYYLNYNKSTSTISSEIQSNISDYFKNQLLVYDTKLKYSNLIHLIDELPEVSNNLTDLILNIKFNKTTLSSFAYSFETRNALLPSSIDNTYLRDDSLGNIVDKSTLEIIGSVDYTSGRISFARDDMDETDNLLYFKTAIDDIVFIRNNLPILGTTNFTFIGV